MAALCPKCGDDDISTRFQPKGRGVSLADYNYYEEECLKKVCRNCHYKWDVPCKDTVQKVGD